MAGAVALRLKPGLESKQFPRLVDAARHQESSDRPTPAKKTP